MTTVSIVECYTPVSLRTCGSSVSSLVHNRKRLKCGSNEKKINAFRSRTPFLPGSPDLYGRSSISPYQLSLDGVSSPLQSPIPPHVRSSVYSRPSTRWSDTKYTYTVSSSSSSSSCSSEDSFSEEDLDQYVSQNSPDSLQIVGSKPRLYDAYQVPKLVRSRSKTSSQHLVDQTADSPEPEAKYDRKTCPSPENPPPSPVNFQPQSVEGFVIGGHKLMGQERSIASPSQSYSTRDFVPGFVKQPLYHCGKCAVKVVEEERSQSVLQQRINHFVQNRVSPYRQNGEDPVVAQLRQGLIRGQVTAANSDHFAVFLESPTSEASSKTFLEIYNEKKRLKEERDKELKEKQERLRNNIKRKELFVKAKQRQQNLEKTGEDRPTSQGKPKQFSNKQPKKETVVTKEKKTPNATEKEVSFKEHLETTVISDLSAADIVVVMDPDQETKDQTIETPDQVITTKCQVRKCWSDIWPFPTETGSKNTKISDSTSGNDIASGSTDSVGIKRSSDRISPYCPLPNNATPTLEKSEVENGESVGQSMSTGSVSGSKSKGEITSTETNQETPVTMETAMVHDENDGHESRESDRESTMTATVIVPQRDRPCCQWITFNGDNEPILNNGPEVDEGCDTFLKRLQRSKLLSNSDPSLPTNSQFCFEAMVDKRYNRWKRRRRKKKETEYRRSSIPPVSESSDDNEDNDGRRNKDIERIIDKMYEKINGCPRQTNGDSTDASRMRIRRRRQDEGAKTEDPDVVNYDASSEWTSTSDVALLSSSSGQCNGNTARKSPDKSDSATFSDNLCTWPYLEHYKQEIMKIINETPPDQLDDLSKNDWLPDINPYNEMTNPPEEGSSDYFGSTGSQAPPEHEPIVSVRTRSNTPATLSGTPEPGPTIPNRNKASPNSFCYSKWSRSNRPTRNHGDDDKPKLLSRTSASNWSEMGLNPSPAKRVGVVAVGANGGPSTFRAALRPVKHREVLMSSAMKQSKRPKEGPSTTSGVNLPTLSKNAKSQTVPKLDKTFRSKTPKVTKRTSDVQRESGPRPKTQPQLSQSGRRSEQGYHMSAERDLLFRDYYLRSLYNAKNTVNSHSKSFNTGGKLKKTITVDNLDLGNKTNRKKMEEDNLSNLSFTRSFTFSMFDLPEIYKYYNAKLDRRANGEDT